MATAPDIILVPFAQDGNWTQPPQTSSTNFVNFTTGYTPDYEISLMAGNPAAKAVDRPTQNYLFYQAQLHAQNWQQMTVAPWMAIPGGYSQNAFVIRQNASGTWVPYRSLVANNLTDPLTAPLSWEYVPYAHEMLANIPMPQGGAGGSSAALITTPTDFNTFTVPGTFEFQTDATVSGSANSPTEIGGTGVAGMLEVMYWSGTSGAYYITQRFSDRNGAHMMRGCTTGTWSAWYNVVKAQQPTIYGPAMVIGNGSATSALEVSDTTNPQGANIALLGNGTTTPNKFIRSEGGNFQLVNSAYNEVILSIDDLGDISVGIGGAGKLYAATGAFTGYVTAEMPPESDNSMNLIPSAWIQRGPIGPGLTVGTPSMADLNAATLGWSMWQSTTYNTPIASSYGLVHTVSSGASPTPSASNWLFQTAYPTTGETYFRYNVNNGGWSAWAAYANINGSSALPFNASTLTADYVVGYGSVQAWIIENTINGGPLYFETNGYTSNVNIGNSAYEQLYCAEAVTSQAATILGQFEQALGAYASAGGNNTTVYPTASFTAPGPGVLYGFGARNNSAQTGTGASTLYINGAYWASDNTTTTMSHFGAVAVAAGQYCTVEYEAYSPAAFSAYAMAVFTPTI